MRIPKHIGVIPDGNRRWAKSKGLEKEMGYDFGLNPGVELLRLCKENGIEEITYYGFTTDNTKRPKIQTKAFTKACIDAVNIISKENTELLVVGNTDSKMFPKELLKYTNNRTIFGKGGIKVNFLVNYGWEWDVKSLSKCNLSSRENIYKNLKSKDISKIDLIIRWGGRRRLSGFLPVQSVYADFYVVDNYWPNFNKEDFCKALNWYDNQDITLGG